MKHKENSWIYSPLDLRFPMRRKHWKEREQPAKSFMIMKISYTAFIGDEDMGFNFLSDL